MYSRGLGLGDFNVLDGEGNPFLFEQFNQCRAVLIVNVASQCSTAERNYLELQALREAYDEEELAIVAFPCNQFGGQEPGSWQEISSSAERRFGVTFPIMGKVEVNGLRSQPLFAWLKAASGVPGNIEWNFTKFLVVGGNHVTRYSHEVNPSQIEQDIISAPSAGYEGDL
ncbi:Glutathione peroxidase [Ectocarpus siliculosus]|uniref:Glutathione peroxidase n=1 Tax=Ectocarpus siliculosus TaxID=2880 RepID=D8LS13_ECTSI|nr:Glutathione peroxidase [Ectocarpus siliculosus]|eukprot:CBN73797.1 Glutathione peroxidase [Ectocarpus siliculosus]